MKRVGEGCLSCHYRRRREVANRKRLRELLELVRDLVDDEPCEFDHHGYCQAHLWFSTARECPHARAKDVLPDEDSA